MRGAGLALTVGGLLLALAVLLPLPWPWARGFLFGSGGAVLYRAAVPRGGLRALSGVLWGFLPVFLFAGWQTADRALTASTWGRPWEGAGWALFALAFGWGSLRAGRDAGKLWREGARSKPG